MSPINRERNIFGFQLVLHFWDFSPSHSVFQFSAELQCILQKPCNETWVSHNHTSNFNLKITYS